MQVSVKNWTYQQGSPQHVTESMHNAWSKCFAHENVYKSSKIYNAINVNIALLIPINICVNYIILIMEWSLWPHSVVHIIYCIIVYFWNGEFKINDQGYVYYPNQWSCNSSPTGQTLNWTIGLWLCFILVCCVFVTS